MKKRHHKLQIFFQDVSTKELCASGKALSSWLGSDSNWHVTHPVRDGISKLLELEGTRRGLTLEVLKHCQELVDASCPPYRPSFKPSTKESKMLRFHCGAKSANLQESSVDSSSYSHDSRDSENLLQFLIVDANYNYASV